MTKAPKTNASLYEILIEAIFLKHWNEGHSDFEFSREELIEVAAELQIDPPKNLGDAIYSFRYRKNLPEKILRTQPEGFEWIIEGAGRGRYRFKIARATRVNPNASLVSITIPDSTPEIIRAYAMDDEQALLAIIRYNRLIDIFLGLTTYSLQNHLRTTVDRVGQIEIDELYVGIDTRGCHYIIPIQAKGGSDQIGVVQTKQDIQFSEQKFPGLRCRPIAAQFMQDDILALFELTFEEDELKIVEERHYKLIPASQIDKAAIKYYR